jgi:hypothetical protein
MAVLKPTGRTIMRFQAYVNGDCGTFTSFFEAFKVFFEKTIELLHAGCALQILETAVWIEIETDDGGKAPIMFYDARDLGHDIGILHFDEETNKANLIPPPEDEAGQQAYQAKLANGLRELGIQMAEQANRHFQQRICKAVDIVQEHGEDAASNFVGRAAMETGIMTGASLNLFEAADAIAE